MKISELIKKLEILKERNGDNDLRFTVTDFYSRYGEEMDFELRVGDTTGLPSDWYGSMTNNDINQTCLKFHLKCQDNKKPKIIYRK